MSIDTLHSFGFEGEMVELKTIWARGRILLPENTWDPSKITLELSSNVLDYEVPVPFTISAKDRFGREITLRTVGFSRITKSLVSQKGIADVEIKHVGRIELASKIGGEMRRSISFALGKVEYLSNVIANSKVTSYLCESEELLTLDLPEFGDVTFTRVWLMWLHRKNLSVGGGCGLWLNLKDSFQSLDLDKWVSRLRTALSVPSILMRQRIPITGWEENTTGRLRIFSQPLDPITTQFWGFRPGEYLFHENDLQDKIRIGCQSFSLAEPAIRNAIERISLGLVPFLEYRHGERFLAMFYGFEACRRFASKKPSDEVASDTKQLLTALEVAKSSTSGQAGVRLQGIINQIESGPKVDLRIQLEEVLDRWKVYRSDLWPLFGTEALPGLKNIRDKLSHKGGTAVNNNSIVIATQHLSVLLERLVLAFLGLSIEGSTVSSQYLLNDVWFSPTTIRHEQERAFAEPQWN